MKNIHVAAKEAVEAGQLLQVVLADEEGLIVENIGKQFPPEALIASFLGTGSAIDRIRELLGVGPIEELVVRLSTENLRLSGRFFLADDEYYLLIMVVPPGSGYRVLSTRLIQSFSDRVEGVEVNLE